MEIKKRHKINQKTHRYFKVNVRGKYITMPIQEVHNDLLKIRKKHDEYIRVIVPLEGGSADFPFKFSWFERLVSLYGIKDAISYAVFIILKWIR